jgi:hypothetical protein
LIVRARSLLVAASACAVLSPGTAPPARAASLFEIDVWMRDIDQRSVTVQQHLARGAADAARADARRIEALYTLLEDHYAQGGRPPDAREISRDGKEQAAVIAEALDRLDFDAARAAALRITRACNDCHDNHKFY